MPAKPSPINPTRTGIVDVLRRMGLANARLGLELDAWNLAPADVARLQAELPGALEQVAHLCLVALGRATLAG